MFVPLSLVMHSLLTQEFGGAWQQDKGAKPRLQFLDNVKVACTVLVVLHHVSGSFIGQGWIIHIGAYSTWMQPFGHTFQFLNQSYFMCLFFFISGQSVS